MHRRMRWLKQSMAPRRSIARGSIGPRPGLAYASRTKFAELRLEEELAIPSNWGEIVKPCCLSVESGEDIGLGEI